MSVCAKFSLSSQELLTMGCCQKLGLGKAEPLSPRSSCLREAAQLPELEEKDSQPQHKNCKYCLGRATWWDTDCPQQISRAPFSGARERRLLRKGSW